MSGFGELEADIMKRLWRRGDTATVRDIFEELRPERRLAYTTVMTVMDTLHRKGWLSRERDGRAWRYQPIATQEEYTARLMREALDGSTDQALAFTHFVEKMTKEESKILGAALRRHDRRRGR